MCNVFCFVSCCFKCAKNRRHLTVSVNSYLQLLLKIIGILFIGRYLFVIKSSGVLSSLLSVHIYVEQQTEKTIEIILNFLSSENTLSAYIQEF